MENVGYNTVELHLSGLIGTASRMQKIRIIGCFFEKGYFGSLNLKQILQTSVLGYIFIYVQIKH